MIWEIMVPRRLPSLNELKRKYRHPQAYRRLRREWADLIYYGSAPVVLCSCRLALDRAVTKPGQPAYPRRRVTFTRLMGPRCKLLDDDNLAGGLKPVRDLLTRGTEEDPGLGLIVDDDAASAEFVYLQRRDPRGPALLISIDDLTHTD